MPEASGERRRTTDEGRQTTDDRRRTTDDRFFGNQLSVIGDRLLVAILRTEAIIFVNH